MTDGLVDRHDGRRLIVGFAQHDAILSDPIRIDNAVTGPSTVGKEGALVANFSGKDADEVARKGNALAFKGTVFHDGRLASALQDARFFGGERTTGGFNRVVVRHRPDVSEDERRFRYRVAVETLVPGPRNGA